MLLTELQVSDFRNDLWASYRQNGRSGLPWRNPEVNGQFDPYKIMVSELMLQQTQVGRVIPKYLEFLDSFPTLSALAGAELGDVLRIWQGLGYNRRAKFLWLASQQVTELGRFPTSVQALVELPGIGINTAGAILAYVNNQPVIYIETNVRTVYLHHFFVDQSGVQDSQILELLEQTIDRENSREFYWALMDYGSHLKQTVGNLNKASKQYTKQSTFHGSKRQIRGLVLKSLSAMSLSYNELRSQIPDERLLSVLSDLSAEGMILEENGAYHL